MPETSSCPQNDDFVRMVAEALTSALEKMLSRHEGADRLTLLKTLRSQMESAFAEAPIKGNMVQTIVLRARMAAIFEGELTQMENAEYKRLANGAT